MDLAGLIAFIRSQPLLALALAAVFITVIGGMLRGRLPRLGGAVRGLGNLALVATLLLTIAQVARISPNVDIAIPGLGMPEQEVSGTETRVRMARDGHFWIRAQINGRPARFMVDTGATLTAIGPETAQAALVKVQERRNPVMLNTANGTIPAELATIASLSFGNIVARDLDAVIVPGIGATNVLGMNLLSRLASWRVERGVLILVPNNPQQATDNN